MKNLRCACFLKSEIMQHRAFFWFAHAQQQQYFFISLAVYDIIHHSRKPKGGQYIKDRMLL